MDGTNRRVRVIAVNVFFHWRAIYTSSGVKFISVWLICVLYLKGYLFLKIFLLEGTVDLRIGALHVPAANILS